MGADRPNQLDDLAATIASNRLARRRLEGRVARLESECERLRYVCDAALHGWEVLASTLTTLADELRASLAATDSSPIRRDDDLAHGRPQTRVGSERLFHIVRVEDEPALPEDGPGQ